MKFLLEIIGIAGDIQSAAEIVEILKENAKAYWISSLGVLVLFILLLIIIRLRIYWKMSRVLSRGRDKKRIRDFTFSALTKHHDETFPDSNLSAFHMLMLILLAGLAFVSLIAGIIQLIIYCKYSG